MTLTVSVNETLGLIHTQRLRMRFMMPQTDRLNVVPLTFSDERSKYHRRSFVPSIVCCCCRSKVSITLQIFTLEATHLVCCKPSRSEKFLAALAAGESSFSTNLMYAKETDYYVLTFVMPHFLKFVLHSRRRKSLQKG